MYKLTFFIFLTFIMTCLNAQDYQINFSAQGASSSVDSVIVDNLTQHTSLKLAGNDILHLLANVGINNTNTDDAQTLNIYPNPFKEFCNIEFKTTASGNALIKIIDITGKEITRSFCNLQQGYNKYQISGLSRGIYFVQLISKDILLYGKIIQNDCDLKGIAKINHLNTTNLTSKTPQNTNDLKLCNTKNIKSLILMQYNEGDLLKITGTSNASGSYISVSMLTPTGNQTLTFNFVSCTDADANSYSVIQIGTQQWMTENLKTTKYPDGTPIPSSSMNVCNGDSATISILGYLYDWNALMNNSTVSASQGACPDGWHVPTVAEYDVLINFLGGANLAGKAMKSTDAAYWNDISFADNSSGFSALGGGYTLQNMVFYYKSVAKFWTSTEDANNTKNAREVQIEGSANGLFNSYGSSKTAVKSSCRCIKD